MLNVFSSGIHEGILISQLIDHVPFGFGVAGAGVAVPDAGVAGTGVPGGGETGAGVAGVTGGVAGVPGFVTGGVAGVPGFAGGVVVVAGGAATSGIFRSLGSVGTHANSSVNRVRSIGIGVFPSSFFLPAAVDDVSPRGPPIVLVVLEGGPFGYHITTSIGGSCVMTGCEIPMSEIGTRGPLVSRCL